MEIHKKKSETAEYRFTTAFMQTVLFFSFKKNWLEITVLGKKMKKYILEYQKITGCEIESMRCGATISFGGAIQRRYKNKKKQVSSCAFYANFSIEEMRKIKEILESYTFLTISIPTLQTKIKNSKENKTTKVKILSYMAHAVNLEI